MSIERICEEAAMITSKYGDFNSTHEALGVLTEEFDELKDAIRANSIEAVAHEAMQVSAVALRLYLLCERAVAGGAHAFKARSGADRSATL